MIPDDEVAIVAVEGIQIAGAARSFTRGPERDLTQSSDFLQSMRNARSFGDQDVIIARGQQGRERLDFAEDLIAIAWRRDRLGADRSSSVRRRR